MKEDKVVFVHEDGTTSPVGSLREMVTDDRSRTFFVAKTSSGTITYDTPKESSDNVSSITLGFDVDTGVVDIRITVDVEDLIEVVDPKRCTPAAIEFLREHHKNTVMESLRSKMFRGGKLLLGHGCLQHVLTDKGKTFTFSDGYCWEIAPSNQLIPVTSIPDQLVVDARHGTHTSTVPFTYTAISAYVDPGLCKNIYKRDGSG